MEVCSPCKRVAPVRMGGGDGQLLSVWGMAGQLLSVWEGGEMVGEEGGRREKDVEKTKSEEGNKGGKRG